MNLSKKQEYLIIAGLLVLIFPFFALLLYVHPQGDDFFFATKVNELGVFGFVKDMYLHWSGRYASMFIGAFDPFRYGSLIFFRLGLFSLNISTIIALFLFIKSILYNIFSVRQIIIITLYSYIVFINSLLSIFEFSYWFPSVSAYQLGIALNLVFLSITIFEYKHLFITRWYIYLNSLLAFIIIGLSELFIIPMTIIGFGTIFINFIHKRQLRPHIYILFSIILSSLLMGLAPGNYVRLEHLNDRLGIVESILLSIKTIILLGGYFFQNMTFVLSLLFFAIICRDLTVSKSPFTKINPIYSLATSFLVLLIIVFPASITLGHLPPSRVFNLFSFYFTLLVIVNVIIVLNYGKNSVVIKTPSWVKKSLLSIIILSIFSGVIVTDTWRFSNGDTSVLTFNGNILKAYYTLIFEARDFDKTMSKRTDLYKKAKKRGVRIINIPPLKHYTSLKNFLNMNEFSNEGKYIISVESIYYGLDSVYIEPLKKLQ